MPRKGENIRKRTDGRWEGRYIQSYGAGNKAKYVSVYGKSYGEVRQKLKSVCSPIPEYTSPDDDMTLESLFGLWAEHVRLRVKQSTYADYHRILTKHLLPYFGQVQLSKWNTGLVDQFIEDSLEHGRRDGKGGLSTKTVSDMVYLIRSVMRFAEKEGYALRWGTHIVPPRNTQNEIRVLSVTEQIFLENYLSSDMDRKKLGILICLYTGLRLGEICALRWGDIDFSNKILHVKQTIQRVQNTDPSEPTKTRILIDTPKSKKSLREIPLASKLLTELKKFQKYSEKGAYLLTGDHANFLEPRNYQRQFQYYTGMAGLTHINFHALRHTFATRCIEKGMDAKSLSEILGHASVNITLNRYVHSSMEFKRSQIERLAN